MGLANSPLLIFFFFFFGYGQSFMISLGMLAAIKKREKNAKLSSIVGLCETNEKVEPWR